MNPFSMVVAIIFIVTVGKIIQSYLRTKANQPNPVLSADAVRAADEVRQLKERVAVLERVITDNHGSLGLDREIERLRDR